VAISACGSGSGVLNMGDVVTGVGAGDGRVGLPVGGNNDAFSVDSGHDIVGWDGSLLGALCSSAILNSGG
jgi:hypothetical protein